MPAKRRSEIETLQDRPGAGVRLGGGNDEPTPRGVQRIEGGGDAVIDDGVVHGAAKVALAVVRDGEISQLGGAEQLGKGDAKRWTDQPQQLIGLRDRKAEPVQGILHRPDQTRLRIEERAVKVDEDIHALTLKSVRPGPCDQVHAIWSMRSGPPQPCGLVEKRSQAN